MPDDLPTSWKRQGLKIVGALAATALAALAARHHLDATTWKETVSRLPRWALVLIVAGAPVAWILFEFLGAFFKELGVLAGSGGRSAAQAVGHTPEAVKNVFGRGWDKIAAFSCRRSFDGRYRRRLYEDYGIFNDRGLGLINAARLDLEKVYVELQVGSAQTVPTRMELLRHPVEGRHTIWNFLRAMRPGCGLALIGPPGSGKTTLLQHLLLVFARNRQGRHGHRRLLPILIELRNLATALKEETPPTLAGAIRSYWKTNPRLADVMKREPIGWLEGRLRSRRILLLLDGLDEVPQAQRVEVSAWVQEQMRHEDHRRCLFLLTSRPGGYADAPLPDATVLEVQSFSPEQTSKFIDGWYLANEIVASGNADTEPVRRHASKEADDLRKRLRENPNLYDLTVNPLLLTMVCMVHRYHGALPGSRSQLYGEICQVLLERWRQSKGIAEELNGEQKLAVLRPLAESFMRQEVRELPEQDILHIITAPLASVGYKDEAGVAAGQRFLRFIQSSSGLLLEKEKGLWSFAHKTFQEYLTAEHWLRNPGLAPDWTDEVASPWWRETLLLFAARTDASGLVEAALAKGSPASWGLAYQCLREAQSLRSEVRDRAKAALHDALRSDDPTIFTPAAMALHYFLQCEVRSISEKVEQRITLVTQAEYQLFLNGLEPDDRFKMVPLHWTTYHFTGEPESPVLGVGPLQAGCFAEWANRSATRALWRLPTGPETVESPLAKVAYWCSDGALSITPTKAHDAMEGWARHGTTMPLTHSVDRRFYTSRTYSSALTLALDLQRDHNFNRDLDLDRVSARTRDLALALALSLDLDNALDLRYAEDRDLALDLAHARAHARDLARVSASGRWRTRVSSRDYWRERVSARAQALARRLVSDLASVRAHVPVLDLAIDLAHDLAIASDVDLDLADAILPSPDVGKMRAISGSLRQQAERAGASVTGARMRLLGCVLEILCAGDDRFAARRGEIDYELCLSDIIHPHLSRDSQVELASIRLALRNLRARAAGETEPYEGILLVRDKIVS